MLLRIIEGIHSSYRLTLPTSSPSLTVLNALFTSFCFVQYKGKPKNHYKRRLFCQQIAKESIKGDKIFSISTGIKKQTIFQKKKKRAEEMKEEENEKSLSYSLTIRRRRTGTLSKKKKKKPLKLSY